MVRQVVDRIPTPGLFCEGEVDHRCSQDQMRPYPSPTRLGQEEPRVYRESEGDIVLAPHIQSTCHTAGSSAGELNVPYLSTPYLAAAGVEHLRRPMSEKRRNYNALPHAVAASSSDYVMQQLHIHHDASRRQCHCAMCLPNPKSLDLPAVPRNSSSYRVGSGLVPPVFPSHGEDFARSAYMNPVSLTHSVMHVPYASGTPQFPVAPPGVAAPILIHPLQFREASGYHEGYPMLQTHADTLDTLANAGVQYNNVDSAPVHATATLTLHDSLSAQSLLPQSDTYMPGYLGNMGQNGTPGHQPSLHAGSPRAIHDVYPGNEPVYQASSGSVRNLPVGDLCSDPVGSVAPTGLHRLRDQSQALMHHVQLQSHGAPTPHTPHRPLLPSQSMRRPQQVELQQALQRHSRHQADALESQLTPAAYGPTLVTLNGRQNVGLPLAHPHMLVSPDLRHNTFFESAQQLPLQAHSPAFVPDGGQVLAPLAAPLGMNGVSISTLNAHETVSVQAPPIQDDITATVALAASPDSLVATGVAMREAGKPDAAAVYLRAALNADPKNASAATELACAMRDCGRGDDAARYYGVATQIAPGCSAHHTNLGNTLKDLNRVHESIAAYKNALAIDPGLTDVFCNLVHSKAIVCDWSRRDEEYKALLRIIDEQLDAIEWRENAMAAVVSAAVASVDLHANDVSFPHAKMTVSANGGMEVGIGTTNNTVSTIHPKPAVNSSIVGTGHCISGCPVPWQEYGCDARECVSDASAYPQPQLSPLSVMPVEASGNACESCYADDAGSTTALSSSGAVRHEAGDCAEDGTVKGSEQEKQHRDAWCERVGRVESSRRGDEEKQMYSHTNLALGQGILAGQMLPSALPEIQASVVPSVQPFHALIWPLPPEKFRAIAKAYAARAEVAVATLPRPTLCVAPPDIPHLRLRVGYVSSDLCNHPFSHLTQSIYGMHRTGGTVECFCYSLSPSDGSVWRDRIEAECEPGHFRDISGMSVQESANAIVADGIHVLINCNGYTKGARTELFALRPAPVQVAFMGFAGSLGARYIEYFLTDQVVSPPALADRMHTEKLLFHPHSYFVNDHKQTSCRGPSAFPRGPLTRASYGLPEDCFLFCNCNQLYKLEPATLDAWARILQRVPNSKLWLLRFPGAAEQNVRSEARARGIHDSRIVFTDCASKEEHVARCGLADMFLDTPTCNAHTSGTDALWSGLPMVTVAGQLFASRVAASLLVAGGFPELVASNLHAYEEIAVELATNPLKLGAIRARLEASRDSSPLFDTLRWVRNTEALYLAAWKRYEAGLEPEHIYGVDVYTYSSGGRGEGVAEAFSGLRRGYADDERLRRMQVGPAPGCGLFLGPWKAVDQVHGRRGSNGVCM